MLPWGHAAVGYLVYSLAARYRGALPLDGWAVVALGFGTQFPDLVDKPLAWTWGLLVAGRSLGHSVLTLGLVSGVVLTVARRRGWETLARAFLLGYASHLVADAFAPVARGDYQALRYALYPVVPVATPEHDYGFLEFFLGLRLTPTVTLGLVLTALALLQWYRDGLPGLAELRSLLPGGRTPTRPDSGRDR